MSTQNKVKVYQWKDINDASEWEDIPPRVSELERDWYDYFKSSPYQVTRVVYK